MNWKRLVVCVLTSLITACSSAETASPTVIPPTQTSPAGPAATSVNGQPVTLANISLNIPAAIASDAHLEAIPATTDADVPPWEVAPAHSKIALSGYTLEGKFHEPAIYIYPADEFAQASSIAAEQIDRLKKLLQGSPPLLETLPVVPFFNATPLIAAQIQIIPFQGGRGVRSLTQYAQYNAPVNNRELFYHFQGLTEDGKTYVVAILPITAPVLAEDEKLTAAIPADGVPVPTDIGPNDVYYTAITERLNSLTAGQFTPALDALDGLIGSLLVTNP